MFVYFLRHANAGQPHLNAKKDEKRALDKDGIEQCGYVGRALCALGVQVDVIVSSPLKRATQTAALVGNEMGHEGKLVIDSTPATGGRHLPISKNCWRTMRGRESIMLVGHNPNLSEFSGARDRRRRQRGGNRAEESSGRESRNAPQCRLAELVHYAPHPADALHGGNGKLPPEDFAEIIPVFFNRPCLQIQAGIAARRQL